MVLVANKILVASGIAFWVIVGVYAIGKSGLLNRPGTSDVSKTTEAECGMNEEYIVTPTGKRMCVKKPKDAGKECTKSGECESGKCVTKEAKATKGICFDSNYHIACVKGYWTIEESQTKRSSAIIPDCAY